VSIKNITLRVGLICAIQFLYYSHFALICPIALAQVPATPPESANLPWWKQAVIYEIFVRSYQDSNNDGVGDLDGITSRLDDLHSLGIDALWLTPIYPSPSYHGYDISNYVGINPSYGDEASFKQLLKEAHLRSLRVILDIALNQTSDQHPWFQAASQDPQSPYFDYYLWSPNPVYWTAVPYPLSHWFQLGSSYYFASFSKNMPDLNWKNKEVISAMKAVFKKWIDMGVDGFRLDAAKFLVKGPEGETDTPETHALLKDLIQSAKQIQPETYFVSEVWSDAQTIATYYGDGQELDESFNFPLSWGIMSSLQEQDPKNLIQVLREQIQTYKNVNFPAPFLSNHDQIRVATQLGGDQDSLKLAATLLMTLPGTPYVYYGEEIGMPNAEASTGIQEDIRKRTPMIWSSDLPGQGFTASPAGPWTEFSTHSPEISVQAQNLDPNSLLNFYQKLIQLHHQELIFSTGELILNSTSDPSVLSYTRYDSQDQSKNRLTVVIHFGKPQLNLVDIQLAAADLTQPSCTQLLKLSGTSDSQWSMNSPDHLRIKNLGATAAALFKTVSGDCYPRNATTSISTQASFGSRATSTVERAGGASLK
jgi:glycosidase